MPKTSINTDGRSFINLLHIYKVLEENNTNGLVAVNPVNVFYLINHVSFYDKMQRRDASFAVFPREKSKPTILVVGSGDLWTIVNAAKNIQ